jgi:hypothetical protein
VTINSRESWEAQLRAELKLPDVSSKLTKALGDGSRWPTLSLEDQAAVSIPAQTPWKKASQTYVHSPQKAWLQDDLDHGVKCFFFTANALSGDHHRFLEEGGAEVFIIDHIIRGFETEEIGGHSIQELALLASKIIESQESTLRIGVFVDAQFFKNIAKIRAARLLTEKILQEKKLKTPFQIIALTSFREWTLFERYSNMLRNEAAVASALIAGADFVQSSGYQTIFELEGLSGDLEHEERSRRMARNTSHILALESMLGVVDDAAYGSFHLEGLTQHYASEAWKLMQKILTEGKEFLHSEAMKVQQTRSEQVKTRKYVLAGMNDFPDVKEKLSLVPKAKFFRIAQDFENLRLQMNQAKKRPRVYLAVLGDYANLNARANFLKNYFELLGLEVVDHGKSSSLADLHGRPEEIIALCASDEDYPQLTLPELKNKDLFVAGKVPVTGFENLFAGQNVYNVLRAVAEKWGRA